MTIDEFTNELDKKCIEYNDNQLELLRKYAEFLLDYNKNVNLTAIRDLEGVYLKHFYDSILVFSSVSLDFNKINSLFILFNFIKIYIFNVYSYN